MRLRILSVGYPFAPVREETAGGAEHMLAMLDRALCRAGHQSVVLACEGSKVSGKLLATPFAEGLLDGETQLRIRRNYKSALTKAIEISRPDLVHLHGIDFLEYLPSAGVPVVATLHLPPSWYPAGVFEIKRPDTWLHCVSRSQQEVCPKVANLLPYIPNGVPEELARGDVYRRDLVAGLGRICPEKGLHLALAAAESAGAPFLLAGQVHGYEEHQRYYREEIVPRLGPRRRFIGAAGWRRKRRLLSAARCLLVPSLAPETSSLVAMEAAMCGTPVVAFRTGALPEIVQDGETGFVVNNVNEMAEAIGKCEGIDPARCREIALERFSERRMAGDYMQMYERLVMQ